MYRTRTAAPPLPKVTEIEEEQHKAWLISGETTIIDVGQENTYVVNSKGERFYCKNYPRCGQT
jgi:hypothetical protein